MHWDQYSSRGHLSVSRRHYPSLPAMPSFSKLPDSPPCAQLWDCSTSLHRLNFRRESCTTCDSGHEQMASCLLLWSETVLQQNRCFISISGTSSGPCLDKCSGGVWEGQWGVFKVSCSPSVRVLRLSAFHYDHLHSQCFSREPFVHYLGWLFKS